MKPYLLQLNENFTQYELINTLRFKSKYSIRLYELIKLKHYKELKDYQFKISVNELVERLDYNFDTFSEFHRRAIKKAIKEINLYSDKTISYELIKQQRTVKEIIFNISTKPFEERMKKDIEAHEKLNKGL